MQEAGYYRSDDERMSAITVLARVGLILILLYFFVILAYTAAVLALVEGGQKLRQGKQAPTVAEISSTVAATVMDLTIDSFWSRPAAAPRTIVILTRVKSALYGVNFLRYHLLINFLCFLLAGFCAGRWQIPFFALVFPLVLVPATTGLLGADLFPSLFDHQLLLVVVMLLQFAAVYAGSIWAKWR